MSCCNPPCRFSSCRFSFYFYLFFGIWSISGRMHQMKIKMRGVGECVVLRPSVSVFFVSVFVSVSLAGSGWQPLPSRASCRFSFFQPGKCFAIVEVVFVYNRFSFVLSFRDSLAECAHWLKMRDCRAV